MANIKQVDWESVEREYSLGVKSNVEIGSVFNISEASIRARAKKFEWKKDLSAKVRIAAESKLREVNCESKYEDVVNRKLTEKELIESTANIQATVILEEREDVKRLTRICELLEKQLETIANDPDSEEDLEKKARINKTLIESRDKVFNMRRRNYGINDNANGDADKEATQGINVVFGKK